MCRSPDPAGEEPDATTRIAGRERLAAARHLAVAVAVDWPKTHTRLFPVAVALAIALLGVIASAAHEASPRAASPTRTIDPRVAYRAAVVSAGGGHFHSLLAPGTGRPLFAGTHLGLFRSDDRGRTWHLATERFSGKDVHALAASSKAIYAATHGQGLLVSRDAGLHWRDDSAGLPGRDLHALAVDPRKPDLLYVWVVGHGLVRREGPRRRWERLAGAAALPDVESLAVHPENPRRLYAGTSKGVWVSEDGGHQWRFPRGGLASRTAGIAVPPSRSDLLLAAALDGVFAGGADATGWNPVVAAPSWWGPLVGFAFRADRPGLLLAVSHEGVVAQRAVAGGAWTPLE